jgi:hypothetical protein
MRNKRGLFIITAMLGLIGPAGPVMECRADTFEYTNFASTAGLILQAHAQPFEGRLRVTPSIPGQGLGAVWRETKQPVKDGFDTTFQIQITGKYSSGADGMAFVIQNGTTPGLGWPGCNIGFGGLTNLLVVKFDNYHWQDHAYGKFDEVAVLTAGSPDTVLWDDATNTLASGTNRVVFSDGAVHTARIVYVPGNLQVYLDDLENPLMTVYLNLTRVLNLDEGRAWVGFTAASGADWQNQDLVSWSFASDDTLSRVRRAMARLQSEETPVARQTNLMVGRPTADSGGNSSTPDLSRYPRINSFNGAPIQINAGLNRTNLVLVSAYEDQARTVTEISVGENGQEQHHRTSQGAVQGTESRQLTPLELQSLRSTLGGLPAESVYPPLDHLVIVSYRDGTNWTTRTYDSAATPVALQGIYDLLMGPGGQNR